MSKLDYSAPPKLGTGWVLAGARLASVVLLVVTGFFAIQAVSALTGGSSAAGPRSAEERILEDAYAAVNQNPQSVHARWQLSLALSTVGQYSQAKSEAETAVKIDPQSVEAFYALGIAFRGLGDSERAIKSFEKGGSLPGSVTEIYRELFYDLGELLSETGRHDEAVAAFGSALASGPEATYVVIRLAEEYVTVGDTDKAKTEYLAALGYNPDNMQIEAALRELGATDEEIEDARNPLAHRSE